MEFNKISSMLKNNQSAHECPPAVSIPKKLERPLTIKTWDPVIEMKHFMTWDNIFELVL